VTPLRPFSFTALVLIFVSPALLFGQAGPRLLNVSPAGAKAGSVVEVVVGGQELSAPKELRFSHPGIAAINKETNRFEVTIATNVPPGIYDVRAVTKQGASNPRAFAVGVLNEVAEEKNRSDAPQKIALESTVNGRTDTNSIDYFRFAAKKGQRVLLRCDTRAIDSKLEPVLVLYDGTAHEVSRSRSGGLLDYTIPVDGAFTVRLHDATYRGGTEFFYRLSVGTFPHVDYVLPTAADAKTRFAVFGRNLPGGKEVDEKAKHRLERLDVELSETDPALSRPLTTMPAQTALDLFEYRVRDSRGASDAVLMRFPTAPVIAEHEPNNTSATAGKLTVPCEVVGQFQANGDRDWFSFEAKKGDVYWIEVVSHRLGCATDPFVVVQRVTTNGATDVLELNDSEANFGGPEFNTSHRDPSGKFEAKESGTYRVQLRDLFTQPRHGPAKIYHLAIRKPAPDFKLVALPGNPLPAKKDAKDVGVTTTTLRRGETLPIKIIAFRRDGFDGMIDVGSVEFPEDVVATSCRIESGKSSALLFLTAGDEAAASIGTAGLRGTAPINGTNVSRLAAPATVVWGTADPANEAAMARIVADTALSVAEASVPVRVHPASNVVETVANKTVKLSFRIDRRTSSTGSVKLKPFGLAVLDSVPEVDLPATETNLVLQIDLREKKVPVGTHVFALQVSPQAKAAADKSKKPKDPPPAFYSAPIVLRVAPAPAAQTNAPSK